MREPHPLKRWRAEQGLTLVQLGKKTGLTDAFLSMVETGDRGVSLFTAYKLSKLTGIPIEDFVREKV